MTGGFVFVGGRVVPAEHARISVFDRGFLYGDSVYETLRVHAGVPFRFDAHVERLFDSGRRIGFVLPMQPEAIRAACLKALHSGPLEDALLRIIVTRGSGALGLDPALAENPQLVVMALPLPELPSSWYQTGRHVALVSVPRNLKGALDPQAKTGNYMNSVLALHEARRRGADDAIMLDHHGRIAEASSSNLFVLRGGVWRTPSLDVGILGGITRQTLIELCRRHDQRVEEAVLLPHDLTAAEEAFLCSSVREIVPIVRLDGESLGAGSPGAETAKLQALYRAEVQAEVERERARWRAAPAAAADQASIGRTPRPVVEAPRRGRARLLAGDVRVGVFVDVANVSGAARRLHKAAVDYANVLRIAVEGRRLVEARAYAIETGADFAAFSRALQEAGFKVSKKKPKVFADGLVKADWDVGIAVDLLTDFRKLDVAVLVSGDGDYVPVVTALQRLGVKVEALAFGERTSAALTRAVDRFTALDAGVLLRS